MLLARVLGQSWGARRAATLDGERLLVVRPLTARPAVGAGGGPARLAVSADHQPLQESPHTLVVVDRLGAGPGELVLVAHGSRCRDLTLGPDVATKELVVAIVDGADIAPMDVVPRTAAPRTAAPRTAAPGTVPTPGRGPR